MTEYLSNASAEKYKCPFMSQSCFGQDCMFWIFRKSKDSKTEQMITDPNFGICGWLGTLHYFLERAPIK